MYYFPQQLVSVDFNLYRDLPDTVPAVLTLGTRVTGTFIRCGLLLYRVII